MNYLKNIPFTNQKNAKKDDEDHTYIEICSQSQILPSPTTTAPINLPVDVEVVDLSLKGRFINNKVVLILCGIFFIIAIVSPIIGLFYHKQLKTHYFTCAVHVYETYNERIGNDIKLFDFVALSLFDFTKKYQRSSHEMFNNKVKENINLVRTAIRIYNLMASEQPLSVDDIKNATTEQGYVKKIPNSSKDSSQVQDFKNNPQPENVKEKLNLLRIVLNKKIPFIACVVLIIIAVMSLIFGLMYLKKIEKHGFKCFAYIQFWKNGQKNAKDILSSAKTLIEAAKYQEKWESVPDIQKDRVYDQKKDIAFESIEEALKDKDSKNYKENCKKNSQSYEKYHNFLNRKLEPGLSHEEKTKLFNDVAFKLSRLIVIEFNISYSLSFYSIILSQIFLSIFSIALIVLMLFTSEAKKITMIGIFAGSLICFIVVAIKLIGFILIAINLDALLSNIFFIASVIFMTMEYGLLILLTILAKFNKI
uniref:Transmembrane protein n=1 Tax=Parastrongyloides trichosuri TaxID=131310 RepID=A0A0N4ZQI1_PARTI